MKKRKYYQIVLSFSAFLLMTAVIILIHKTEVRASTIIDEGSCGANATYTLDDEGLLTISGSGEIGDYAFCGVCESPYSYAKRIKAVIIEDGITGIGEDPCGYCTNMTSIRIPDSVTRIGQYAFVGCEGLTNIQIPENITSIEKGAFQICTGLTSINIPDGVTTIGSLSFFDCISLESIDIPESVINIESAAFAGCTSLSSVSIPKSVLNICDEAFIGCDNLKEIKIYNKEAVIDEVDGYETIPSTTTIYGYKNSTAQTFADAHGNNFVELIENDTENEQTDKNTTENASKNKTKLTTKNTTIKLSKKSYTYNGKAKKPTVKVYNSKGKVLKSKYYTVTYKNNTKVGKATLTIKFKGKYTGTIKATYTIKPKATAFTGTSAKKKSVVLTWKKQTKQVTGYQIQYATNSKFTKNKTTVLVKGAKKSSETITGLSGKTKYYFRIRTYKNVIGKKYYSAWSKTQAVKTK
jgi:hypothetical protein